MEEYVYNIFKKCRIFRASDPPKPSRKVPISPRSRQYNDIVCVDHLHVEQIRLLNVMDSVEVFCASLTVESASLEHAILRFESCWISIFWIPGSIQVDKSFSEIKFHEYIDTRGIFFRLLTPNRHG